MFLNSPIENLPSTSTVSFRKLKSVGINTYWDLLNYFPFRYGNFSLMSNIGKVQPGETVTLKGSIIDFKNIYTKRGHNLQKGIMADGTGQIELVWFNQPYLARIFKVNDFIAVSGEVKELSSKLSIGPEAYEVLKKADSETIHTGRLVPVYPEKNGLSSRLLREKIYTVLNYLHDDSVKDNIEEIFPTEIVSYNNLIKEPDAYTQIHFPKDYFFAKKAQERLGFDELFVIQMSAAITRKEWEKQKLASPFMLDAPKLTSLQNFIDRLPFSLTNAQKRVVDDIIKDLKRPRPMNRFLEGDVGSGKTVVAAIACYVAYLNATQSLLMAPTEILAMQHFKTISDIFKDILKVMLVTASVKAKSKDLEKSDIVVGTHSLIQKKINFKNIGLVVIDEQHRFGVAQRSQLKEKGLNPHLLTMTATPIPRTVALTLYGELDLSVIDQMPKGRLAIKTYLVPQYKRDAGYKWIGEQIQKGTQVFVICPLIEESEVETMQSLKAAKKEYERLQKEIFPHFKLGLIHGRLRSKEKEEVMKKFHDKEFDILVSTSVVEVGIDVPNATIMMIEGADRFGLAQLHQLRGRVGRSDKQSYCFLYTDVTDEFVTKKLQLFAKTQNGIQVAEYDFKFRGPGEIFGTRQHGYANLKIASLADYDLIDKSKKAVNYFMSKYSPSQFPELKRRLNEYRTKQISRD